MPPTTLPPGQFPPFSMTAGSVQQQPQAVQPPPPNPAPAQQFAMNTDGLVIEAVDDKGSPVAADGVMAEYGLIVRQLTEIGPAAEIGGVEQLTIDGDGRSTLIRRLDDNYVAALVVEKGAIIGKAHFYLRVAAPDLAREL